MTVRDWHQSNAVRVIGATSLTAPRLERMLSMRFDGTPLGEYDLPTPSDQLLLKHINEMEALAYAFVGCEADLEVVEMTTQAPRPGKATPDFDAQLRDGTAVLVELSRLTDTDEKRYFDVLSKVAKAVENRTSGVAGPPGEVVFRFYGRRPTSGDVRAAADEIVEVMLADVTAASPSPRLVEVGPRHPTLHALGAHWSRRSSRGPTRMSVDVARQLANQSAVAATFLPIVDQKRAKIGDYSDGKPVWLTLYVDTQLFFPLGIIESLRSETSFDPAPFARVLVGCFTAGVIFDQARTAPRYFSLSSDESAATSASEEWGAQLDGTAPSITHAPTRALKPCEAE